MSSLPVQRIASPYGNRRIVRNDTMFIKFPDTALNQFRVIVRNEVTKRSATI